MITGTDNINVENNESEIDIKLLYSYLRNFEHKSICFLCTQ